MSLFWVFQNLARLSSIDLAMGSVLEWIITLDTVFFDYKKHCTNSKL